MAALTRLVVQAWPSATLLGGCSLFWPLGVIQLTDYASVYLAIASGIDPGQTVAIKDLQARIE